MGRFAADYEGWDRARLTEEARRLELRSRAERNPKKTRNIQERLQEVRILLAGAGHISNAPVGGSSITTPPEKHIVAPPVPAVTVRAQGRGPMGPVGVELDQWLAATE